MRTSAKAARYGSEGLLRKFPRAPRVYRDDDEHETILTLLGMRAYGHQVNWFDNGRNGYHDS